MQKYVELCEQLLSDSLPNNTDGVARMLVLNYRDEIMAPLDKQKHRKFSHSKSFHSIYSVLDYFLIILNI